MGILRPLRVVIENYPDDQDEELDAVNNPENPQAGTRKVPFSRVLYVEQDDFMEDPPRKFFRLAPGREVRLRYAYFITCQEVVKDDSGRVVELRCTYDPATRGGDAPDGRKVKATLHWVSAQHALRAEVRLYDHLFSAPDPDDLTDEQQQRGDDWKANLNPNSLEIIPEALIEPSIARAPAGTKYQLERLGYFCVDPDSDQPGDDPSRRRIVLNRTVTLKDTWARIAKKGK
jgi:glutaminyl-tRNA synthetase